MTVLVGCMFRSGSEQMEKTEPLKKRHLKLQVDTQTQFVLPAVPNPTKRGHPAANMCSAGTFVMGQCSSQQHIHCQPPLSPARVKTQTESPESCAATKCLHLDFVVTVLCV